MAGDAGADPPGHLFVVAGDLTRLACDDVLVPTDPGGTVTEALRGVLAAGEPGPGDARVRRLPGVEGGPVPWAVETASRDDDGWLVDGVLGWLDAVAGCGRPPQHGRARRLAALPLVGTGGGRAAGRRGDLLRALLPRLHAQAAATGVDVALVLRAPSDHAAAQRVRLDLGLPWELPDPLARAAERLAGLAARGELALFLGAGVSAAAGLPLWRELVDALGEGAGLDEAGRGGLAALPPADAASLVARRTGREALRQRVCEVFGGQRHALAHGLLAGLPVRELVTTNYDRLLEAAAEGTGRPLRVLPGDRPAGDDRWLLKLHGDVGDPDSVVLTREEFLDHEAGRAALSGVVEALLLTRHVLFVGLSLLDDNVVRIAHRVAQVRTSGSGTVGTSLSLTADAVRAELWADDLDDVAMLPAGAPTAEAARVLEVVLDRVGALATPPVGYLLDPAYAGLLGDEERALADALRALPLPDPGARAPTQAEVGALLTRLGVPGT